MTARNSFKAAHAWARARDYSGIDPYDALASPVLAGLHRLLGRPFGVAVTQALRRSPVDLRPLLGIRPATNPKALALFLSAAARTGAVDDVQRLGSELLQRPTGGQEQLGWGYPFPWQARAFYFPARTPTVVVTAFAGEALVDAHQSTGDPRWLEAAAQACEFVMTRPHRTEDATGACLSYSPLDRSAVYNASLLGARLLTLVGSRTGRKELLEFSEPLVRYALARQAVDGSWAYGEAAHHRWIDSFHTGFVLGALHVWAKATGDPAAADAVERGLAFYEKTFFGPNGEPYYHAHARYPYDVHSAAQAVLTFCELSDRFPGTMDHARRVGRWMVDHMLDPDGHFYYQIRRTHTVRIPYMRWSQAWGVRALAELVARGVED